MEHLIPAEWFLPLGQIPLLVIALISIGVLIRGADWLVDGASGIAYRLGIPKVIVGATIVSLGTTSPECAVSVMAAWGGEPGLALGNAVGSIIADTALIFGLGCLLATLPADRFVLSRQGWAQFGTATLLAVLCYGAFAVSGDGATLFRPVGVLLLALLAVYMYLSVVWGRQHPSGEPFLVPEDMAGEAPLTPAKRDQEGHGASVVGLAALGFVGLLLVLVSSHTLIQSVSVLAEVHWKVPKVVIAATLVALGTSMPELVVGMTSIYKGHKELLVGNVIGADILNVLFVTGASAVAAPLPLVDAAAAVPRIFLYLHLPTMLIVLGLFRLFIFSSARRGEFRRWMGVPLLIIYVVYVAVQFLLTAGGTPAG